jgi:hypothetical protein
MLLTLLSDSSSERLHRAPLSPVRMIQTLHRRTSLHNLYIISREYHERQVLPKQLNLSVRMAGKLYRP